VTYTFDLRSRPAGGGDGSTISGSTISQGTPRLDTGTLNIDILIKLLKANTTLALQNEGRIVIQNEPK